MSPEFVSNEEIVQAARRNLVQAAWDYLAGASESETTIRRNRLAFDRLAFRPRVLTDVSSMDCKPSRLKAVPLPPKPLRNLEQRTLSARARNPASKRSPLAAIIRRSFNYTYVEIGRGLRTSSVG